MQVNLPDQTVLELSAGATGLDAATQIGPGLAKAALAVKANGELRDLSRELPEGAQIEIVTDRSPEALELVRHDTAHVLAEAVLELYPGTKVSIGPAIDNGFYYDFDFPEGVVVSEADFEKIEAKMQEHIEAAEEFRRVDISIDEALKRFQAEDQPYKVELIEDLVKNEGVETVSLYTNGEFTDLCRGPHAPSTKTVRSFKILSVAGAYWRGNSDNKMLTRIYGTAFLSKKDLKQYLNQLEEARKRDHRKLGKELGLFSFSELSPGSPFWLPEGMQIWTQLTNLWREQNAARGYKEVKTPILYDAELWRQSGHWDKYRDNMYFTEVEGRTMGIKPMNCPAHVQIYNADRHSYRELPIRLSEAGLVHRHEPSGTLHGLMRVRHITQDDAHIFCREDQIEKEVGDCLDFAFYLYKIFGFEPRLELSTRPEKRIGSDDMWDRAEEALKASLGGAGLEYDINPGDGAFYGPKIDLHMQDSIGRSWQLGTVQLDYSMPERFGLSYVGQDDKAHRPVMIHRALLGSFERFIGILIEHYAGVFPFWLSPNQVVVLPVADRHYARADEISTALKSAGIRVQIDSRTESVGRKIRDAEIAKAPCVVVVGDKELESGEVSVRMRGQGDTGSSSLDAFVSELSVANRDRTSLTSD